MMVLENIIEIKTLWIIRHGEAEDTSKDGRDINRDLKERAHRDWEIMNRGLFQCQENQCGFSQAQPLEHFKQQN